VKAPHHPEKPASRIALPPTQLSPPMLAVGRSYLMTIFEHLNAIHCRLADRTLRLPDG